MGKRSSFPRLDRDNYPTPYKATTPLLECLKPRTKFIDPCRDAGCLVAHFESAGHVCVGRYDLPDRDVVSARYDDVEPDAIFLTNLPWRRDVLHPAIINLSNQRPLWTIFRNFVVTRRLLKPLSRRERPKSLECHGQLLP